MKKIIAFSAILFATTLVVHAQDAPAKPGKDHPRQHKMMAMKHKGHMQAELNLTDAQKAEMKTQHEAFKKQMDAINQEKLTAEERRSRIKALQQEQHSKMEQMLTAEQKAKLKQAGEERKNHMQSMGKQKQAAMKTRLHLTAAQDQQLAALRKSNMEKMKAIHNNQSLSAAAKKSQIKALHEEQKAAMQSILTKEQMAKMKEMRKSGHHKKGPENTK